MPEITYANVYSHGLADEHDNRAFEQALIRLRQRPAPSYGHLIAGESSLDGRPFERADPAADDRIVSRGVTADRAVVDRAVACARAALPAWRSATYAERAERLVQAIDALERRRIELAALVSLETGKTRADAVAEVLECIAILELYRDQVAAGDGFVVAHRAPAADARAEVVLRPYGVFGVIAPFNFPLAISFGMAAAALLSGNTVVYKPSALTPACGAAFAELLGAADLPAGVFNLVQGGAETGQALAAADIDGLAFTGSAEVGHELIGRLSRPPYARPVVAEMGGKNPAIVTGAVADVGVAARAVARSAFGMSGQKCNACSRAVVTDDVYEAFVERLVADAAALKVGDPIDADAFTGPVIGAPSVARFTDAVAQADRDGTVRLGGSVGSNGGRYVELTVVDGLEPGHPLTREELFLPLLTVVRVADFDAALAEANAVRYGLAAGLFSDDETERARFLDEIEAGIVFIDNPGGATTGVWPGSQTMSGWKASGSTGKGGFGPWYLQQFGREQSRTVFG